MTLPPTKLNLIQVLVDYPKFERRIIWQEFWSNHTSAKYTPPIFKKNKTNLSTKHPTPQPLKTMLSAVKSEIMDPQNWNKARPNLPFNDLIKLQKNKVITLKPCDKGAGIIILDFEPYSTSCNNHLKSKQLQPDGSKKSFYTKVNLKTLDTAKTVEIYNYISDRTF